MSVPLPPGSSQCRSVYRDSATAVEAVSAGGRADGGLEGVSRAKGRGVTAHGPGTEDSRDSREGKAFLLVPTSACGAPGAHRCDRVERFPVASSESAARHAPPRRWVKGEVAEARLAPVGGGLG